MVGMGNSLISDMIKVLVIWTKDRTNQNIPLNQSPVQSKDLAFFNFMNTERDKEAAEEIFEASIIVRSERKSLHKHIMYAPDDSRFLIEMMSPQTNAG